MTSAAGVNRPSIEASGHSASKSFPEAASRAAIQRGRPTFASRSGSAAQDRRIVDQQGGGAHRAQRRGQFDFRATLAPTLDPLRRRRLPNSRVSRQADQRLRPGKATLRQRARAAPDVLGEPPREPRATADLERQRLHFVEGEFAQAPSSPGNGSPANSAMRSQRSDRGSKLRAPKNASLARRRSIGRIAASIRLSRISA